MAALNGALYTVGGGAFRLDICTDEWTPVEEDGPAQKFFEGCSSANGRIYLLAERRGNTAVPNMVILDPYKDTWQEVGHSLPCPLPIHGVASVRRFNTWGCKA